MPPPKNYGLKLVPQDDKDFRFGGGKLGDKPIQPGGQWTHFVPEGEDQSIDGFEPYCCVSEATDNAIEILVLKKYNETQNLSDRWIAWASGTKERQGNDPKSVADILRKKGNVAETDWPFKAQTFDEFYETPPQKYYDLAREFVYEFNMGYEWVSADPASMMAALEYSPLTAGVWAWTLRDGFYITPPNSPSVHDICIVGYVENEYWLIYDSYAPFLKKLAWDFHFDAVMRFTLDRQIVDDSFWGKFKAIIRSILGL